jgi:signal transduction histidine kinase
MIGTALFRKAYLYFAVVVLLFIGAGFLASKLILEQSSLPLLEFRSAGFYARVIDGTLPSDRPKALAEIIAAAPPDSPFNYSIVDEKGKVLYPPGEQLPMDWDKIPKPTQPYNGVPIDPKAERSPVPLAYVQELIAFSGSPKQYLYVSGKHRPDHGRRRLMTSPAFMWTFGSLIVSVFLGIGVALFLIARSIRENAQLADTVLADMQSGNLKARFPIRPADEIGKMMGRFNLMADEIERLVEQLRSAEKSRTALLQDLAHDLRTPVASMKNLLHTLSAPSMEPAVRDELRGLAMKEAEYFERLVEDLLVLAQVGEPRYKTSQERVSLDLLVADEAESVATKSAKRKIDLQLNVPQEPVLVSGDIHLLRRMIRNALDNAFSFARHEVSVELRVAVGERPAEARILIRDDGPGFSPESLASFGDRRVSRVLGSEAPGENDRLSVGLGSVILKTIADIHGGSATPSNQFRGAAVAGAEVLIVLPLTRKI